MISILDEHKWTWVMGQCPFFVSVVHPRCEVSMSESASASWWHDRIMDNDNDAQYLHLDGTIQGNNPKC